MLSYIVFRFNKIQTVDIKCSPKSINTIALHVTNTSFFSWSINKYLSAVNQNQFWWECMKMLGFLSRMKYRCYRITVYSFIYSYHVTFCYFISLSATALALAAPLSHLRWRLLRALVSYNRVPHFQASKKSPMHASIITKICIRIKEVLGIAMPLTAFRNSHMVRFYDCL